MTLLSQLSRLESAGLIRVAQVDPDLQYLFRHVLVQDAAYASLLSTDQRRLHHAVGRAVEHLYPDRLDEYAPLLAHHFECAGEARLALTYFRRAGDAALAAYANKEAESHYRSAVGLAPLPDAVQQAHLLSGLGEALHRQSRHEEAIESWVRAIQLYRHAGNLDAVARLYARSARTVWHQGDHARGLALCEEGLKAVEGALDSSDMALLLHETGRALYFNGQVETARNFCTRALAMAERHNAPGVQADTLATLGSLPDTPPEEAKAMLTRAVELAETAGLLDIAVRANHNLGILLRGTLADFAGAYRHFLHAADLARRRGAAHEELFSIGVALGLLLEVGPAAEIEALLPRMEHLYQASPHNPIFTNIRATLLERQGEWQQALALRRESHREAQRRGDFQATYDTGAGLAGLLLEMHFLGELHSEQDGQASLNETQEILARLIDLDVGNLGGGIWGLCQMAILRALQQRFAEARSLLAEAPGHAAQKGGTWREIVLLETRGWIAMAARDWNEAVTAFQAAALESGRLGVHWRQARAALACAQALVARGKPADVERAQVLLREARSAFRNLRAPYYVALATRRIEETQTRSHAHVAAFTQASHELALAGRIQAGLLPREIPALPGWQITARLEPARETWGDFYDFIPLDDAHSRDGLLALVIADVADKGAGAALYMALVHTLLRTYAEAHPRQPAAVLEAVNRRLLSETDTGMFVTLFYAVLDPGRGRLTYVNAGHNPPFLLRASRSGRSPSQNPDLEPAATEEIEPLPITGMALGVIAEATWRAEEIEIRAGDAVILYTDGAIDAQTSQGEPFGLDRLLSTAHSALEAGAGEIEARILAAIHDFVDQAPHFDDITLMVISRI